MDRKGLTMSILKRLQRIAKANINWMLDKVDPPEKELEAKIAELQDAIKDGKAAAATYGATFRRLQREVEDYLAKQQEYQQQASAAVQAGDETAARRFLAEKISLAERISNLKPGVEEGQKTFDYVQSNLARLQDQLKQAKLKLAELKSRQRAASARQAFGEQLSTVNDAVGQGEIFERMEDQVAQDEALAEVIQDLQSGDVDLEQRSRELQIEAELAKMRESFNSPNSPDQMQ